MFRNPRSEIRNVELEMLNFEWKRIGDWKKV